MEHKNIEVFFFFPGAKLDGACRQQGRRGFTAWKRARRLPVPVALN